MTKEQEKAIERLNSYKSHIENCGNIKSKHYKSVKTALNLIQTQQNDIQRMQELLDLSDANNVKKEKTINEMAKQLYILGFCKELKCKRCTANNFTNCIKQYFERKIENE